MFQIISKKNHKSIFAIIEAVNTSAKSKQFPIASIDINNRGRDLQEINNQFSL